MIGAGCGLPDQVAHRITACDRGFTSSELLTNCFVDWLVELMRYVVTSLKPRGQSKPPLPMSST